MSRNQENELQAAGRRITFGRTPQSLESVSVETPQDEEIRQSQRREPRSEQPAQRRRPNLPEQDWSPRNALRSREQVRRAIILNELLDPPKALQRLDEF